MELQKILFPSTRTCMEHMLYYRHDAVKVSLDPNRGCMLFEKDGVAKFDTYFNGFSIGKWKKYTVLTELELHLELRGDFVVALFNHELVNNSIVSNVICERHVHADERTEFTFSFSGFSQKGMHAFSLLAESDDSVFYGGNYTACDEDSSKAADISLALNMCTFKKEKFIYRNVRALSEELLENPESPFYQRLHFYITDNAMTLEEEKMPGPFIHLTKQNAFGSVGGFTRGLLQIMSDQQELGFTHTLFLDDDILIDPQVLCRTLMFLRMIKDEYRHAWIGGGMLGLDFPRVQTESGGCFEGPDYQSLKLNADLGDLYQVLYNEIEEGARINAWWYCCMPLSSIDDAHLPYPVYFHCDDMEYALRQCKKLILLNGLCVWHDEFFYKPITYYYDKRNREILYALHFPDIANKCDAKKRLRDSVLHQILWYRYQDAHDILDAFEDFLKGPQWLVSFDDRKKFNDVSKKRYAHKPVEDLPVAFDYDKYLQSLAFTPEKKPKHLLRVLTFNGWLLPARGDAITCVSVPQTPKLYRARRVLNYAVNTNSGYVTEKSYKEALYILRRLLHVQRLIDKDYTKAAAAYRETMPQVTTRDFWEQRFAQQQIGANERRGQDDKTAEPALA